MRKDNRGRNLREGEYQYATGQYKYTWTDPLTKKRKSKRSWRLLKSDRTPKGKKETLSIREIAEEIEKNNTLQIIDNNITVKDLVNKYLSLLDVKATTMYTYRANLIYIKDFENLKIKEINISMAKTLIKNINAGYSIKSQVKIMLKNAFKLAVEDNLVLKNPFAFNMRTIQKNDTEKITPLTEKERDDLLYFVWDKYNKWYNGVYVLFHTGLRIAEFCGLKIGDVKKNMLYVNRQIVRLKGQGLLESSLKTDNGKRVVPITRQTNIILAIEFSERKSFDNNYIFQTRKGTLTEPCSWWRIFNEIGNDYGIKLHPHLARHTFCSILANKNINPKALQKIMGHGKIETTLNFYTELTDKQLLDHFAQVVATQEPQDFQKWGELIAKREEDKKSRLL